MDFPACDKRQKLVMFEADGTRNTVRRCAEQTAPAFQQDVTPEVCDLCPVRSFVLKRKEREKAAPLKVKDIFAVKKVEKHKPEQKLWVSCSSRESVTVGTCCGGSAKVIRCSNHECAYDGQEVTPVICSTCQHRKE